MDRAGDNTQLLVSQLTLKLEMEVIYLPMQCPTYQLCRMVENMPSRQYGSVETDPSLESLISISQRGSVGDVSYSWACLLDSRLASLLRRSPLSVSTFVGCMLAFGGLTPVSSLRPSFQTARPPNDDMVLDVY